MHYIHGYMENSVFNTSGEIQQRCLRVQSQESVFFSDAHKRSYTHMYAHTYKHFPFFVPERMTIKWPAALLDP